MTVPATAPAAVWSGLLPVDKPAGMTSHDVVDRARRRLRQRGVGHLGTLDPGATGLLVLALGAATRCASVWQGGEKLYSGQARFGLVTDSQDVHGRVLERREWVVDEASVRAASARLTGDLLQVPPMVSALKHHGERLHALARRGETVERAARPVHVAEWTWTSFAPDSASFTVRCSGGTYVRTLVHDLGARLGCGAALAGLRRLASAPFTLERACPWAALDGGVPAEVLAAHGVPLDRALEALPAVRLEAREAEAAGHGLRVPVRAGDAPLAAGPRSVVLRDADGRAIALGELEPGGDAGGALACPHLVFPWAVREGPRVSVAVAVGVFDGLHAGHQALIERATGRAAGGRCVAVSFDPHPDVVLAREFRALPPLTPLPEKQERLARMGAELVVLPFTRELASLAPETFVDEHLVAPFSPDWLVVGEDFALGRARAGNVARLRELGVERGFGVDSVPLVRIGGEPVSSTRIRALLAAGDVAGAAALFGRPYSLSGQVVHGDALGRTLGFPTANLRLHHEKCVPSLGIYAVWARIEGEDTWRPAAMSVGVRPTFGGQVRTLEVYLIDWSGDLYGRELEVRFIDWIRPELRFKGPQELIEAIANDVGVARQRLAESPPGFGQTSQDHHAGR